jgi:hypothetical protein
MLISKKNRREVYKYLFKGKTAPDDDHTLVIAFSPQHQFKNLSPPLTNFLFYLLCRGCLVRREGFQRPHSP